MAEENKVKNANIETYADDMAKVIGDNENGMVKKIIEEEEKHKDQNKKNSSGNKTNKLFLFKTRPFVDSLYNYAHVLNDKFDERDLLGNMLCGAAQNIRTPNIQTLQTLPKLRNVFVGDLPDGNSFTLCAFFHFVLALILVRSQMSNIG